MEERFRQNQILALCTVAFLAPALRLYPAIPATLAGRAAWLSPLAALPVLLLYGAFLRRLLGLRREGETLPALGLRLLPGRLGRAVPLVLAAWLLLYASFSLRASAQRFLVTIYPQGRPAFFLLSMGLVCLVATLGPRRSLVRVAKLVLPALLGVLLLIFPMALGELEKENLLPLTFRDGPELLKATLPCLDLLALPLYLSCFFPAGTAGPDEGRALQRWVLWLCLLLLALGLMVVGRLGAALTARLSQPFFTMVRNLVFLQSLERIEALVVSLWVFPDFLLISLLLQSAQHCLRLFLDSGAAMANAQSPGQDRRLVCLCGGAAILLSLLIGRDAAGFRLWSERLIPALNLGVAFGLIPLAALLGRKHSA